MTDIPHDFAAPSPELDPYREVELDRSGMPPLAWPPSPLPAAFPVPSGVPAPNPSPADAVPGGGLGVASLVLGVVALVLLCVPLVGMLLGGLAVALGIASVLRRNRGTGIAGIATGGAGLLVQGGFLIALLVISSQAAQ